MLDLTWSLFQGRLALQCILVFIFFFILIERLSRSLWDRLLHVKVVGACKLLKMDILGASDPYVNLSPSGERLPAKKTSVKTKTLNPEWNEDFNLIVKVRGIFFLSHTLLYEPK